MITPTTVLLLLAIASSLALNLNSYLKSARYINLCVLALIIVMLFDSIYRFRKISKTLKNAQLRLGIVVLMVSSYVIFFAS